MLPAQHYSKSTRFPLEQRVDVHARIDLGGVGEALGSAGAALQRLTQAERCGSALTRTSPLVPTCCRRLANRLRQDGPTVADRLRQDVRRGGGAVVGLLSQGKDPHPSEILAGLARWPERPPHITRAAAAEVSA